MSSIKIIATSLVTGAVASAVTTLVIAKVTAAAPVPRCEATGTKLAPTECALVTKLAATDREQGSALTDARRRVALLEETARLTAAAGFFCAGAPVAEGSPRVGECFRSVDACVTARASDQVCWRQDDAVCFAAAGGATRCATSADRCVELATAAGLGAEARAACRP